MPIHDFDDLDAELGRAAEGFLSTHQQAPLDHGIRVIGALLRHPQWDQQPKERQAQLLSQGAGCLLNRFKLTGRFKDLEDAVNLLRAAEQLLEPNSPQRGGILGNLGVALRNLAEQTGDDAALDQAITANRAAAYISSDKKATTGRLVNLAMSLFFRFTRRGAASDLQEVRDHLAAAAESTTEPERLAFIATNRAIVEGAAFDRSGSIAELEKAIEFAEEALRYAPPGHPARAPRLNNLAISLGQRLLLTGRLADGRRAIDALTEVLEATGPEHAEHGMRALNLGNAQFAMFLCGHDPRDLQGACESFDLALASVPAGHSYRFAVLMALSEALARTGALARDVAICDRAVDLALQAINSTAPEAATRARALHCSGNALLYRGETFGSLSDLDAARMAFEEAEAAADAHAAERDLYALAQINARRAAARLAGNADAIRPLVCEPLPILQKLEARFLRPGGGAGLANLLSMTRRGLTEGAFTIGETVRAIELLEQSKAMALRRNIRRTERVPAGLTQEAAVAYRATVERLRALSIALETDVGSEVGSRSVIASEAITLDTQLAEFERGDPLLVSGHMSWEDLRATAVKAQAAIVYLSVGEFGPGRAVVLHPGSPDDGPLAADVCILEQLTQAHLIELMQKGMALDVNQVESLLESGFEAASAELGWATAYHSFRMEQFGSAAHEVAEAVWKAKVEQGLEWLDHACMQPVVKRLEDIGAKNCLIIPDARLALLPLHAAKSMRQSSVESCSYAPSAGVIRAILDRVPTSQVKFDAAIVADPDGTLAFAELEAREVAAAIERAGGVVSRGHGVSWFCETAHEARMLIISTHAVFEPADAYRSHILLGESEEILSLAGLLAGAVRSFVGASVFVNACEAAIIDSRLAADEHLGFPGAFMLSGANFVAASLWRMSDLSAALFSVELVRSMLAGNRGASAVRTAAEHVRTLRREAVVEFLSAATPEDAAPEMRAMIDETREEILSGDELPFEHPIFWACFAANGV